MVVPWKKKVFVIWGPPCSGKTTLVKEKKQPGDLVIDMDMIHHAITLKDLHERDQAIVPIAIATKRFLIDQASLANPAKRVWLIVSEPNENRVIEFCSTFDQVDLVAMKRVSKTEALRRLYSSNRKRKDKYEALIINFYKQNPRWGRVGQISEG